MKTILKIVGSIIGIILLVFVMLIGYLSITEYKPADIESMEINGASDIMPDAGQPMRIMSWNIGYGALGDNADFFMDGGSGVMTADNDRVHGNINSMTEQMVESAADIYLVQEIDINSRRSRHVDETKVFSDAIGASMDAGMQTTFGNNYKVAFIPFPIPPLGKVNSGIMTFSRYHIDSAERVNLPCPFKWPVRAANLKRGLLVSRMPVAGTDKKLVVVNLHLEAYDSGAGKIAQTKKLIEVLEAEREAGNYVIAGGDFNQLFSNIDASAYPVYEGKWQPGIINSASFPEGWSLLMDPSVPTCRSLDQPYAGADLSNFQFYMIDGFIVSDNIKVENLETLDCGFKYSDHNPVVMDFVLIPANQAN